jgi:hypothetical protein
MDMVAGDLPAASARMLGLGDRRRNEHNTPAMVGV